MFFSRQPVDPIRVSKLSEEKPECLNQTLNQISEWIEKKWGYLTDYPGLKKRRKKTLKIADELYLVKYDQQLVGIFRLGDVETPSVQGGHVERKELTHVYVDERRRDRGWGKRIIEIAKNTARSEGIDIIVLETLHPKLNRFYKKQGAKEMGETRFLGAPAVKLEIDLREQAKYKHDTHNVRRASF